MATQKELNEIVGRKMKLLGIRARDPNHPMHNIIQWSSDGLPIMPDDNEERAKLVLAALDEPDPS